METAIAQQVTNRKWYEIWWDVWRHPGTDVFRRLLQDPDTGYVRGFKWVVIIAVIGTELYSLTSRIYLQMAVSAAADLMTDLFFVIVGSIAAVMGITITAGIYHWVAKLFGGNGKWGQLVFCFSAIQAPLSLLAALFYFLALMIIGNLYSIGGDRAVLQQESLLSFCMSLPALALTIMFIVLSIGAIKAVENINTWRSILTYFIPGIVAILLVGGVTVFLMLPTR